MHYVGGGMTDVATVLKTEIGVTYSRQQNIDTGKTEYISKLWTEDFGNTNSWR